MRRVRESTFGVTGRRFGRVGAVLLLAVVQGAVAVAVLPTMAATPAAAASTVTEYTAGITQDSDPYGMTVGSDGNLWFTEPARLSLAKSTPAGTVTELPASTATHGGPHEIATGPDSNLWFTESVEGTSSDAAIGRLTTGGSLTEFTTGIPTTCRPAGITTGPDGNLWFTEALADKIVRMTTAGAVTTFSTGITAGSYPNHIVTGPDGNLWFTEQLGGRIGRITPTGTVTEFPLPVAGSNPVGIAAGPDGNLWFTEILGSKVGRITPTGTITEFTTPTASAGPSRISAGPDGNLWFTEAAARKIGRITTGGVTTEPGSGLTGTPSHIVSGPDGRIWFTEQGNAIGAITADATGSRFFGLPPKRLLDSRDGTGGYSTPWGPGAARTLQVTGGSTTVPDGADTVVLNVTGVNPSADTHVTVWPTGEAQPLASNVNLPPGTVRPNLVVVKVGAGGQVSLFNNAGTIDLLADVVGYFASDSSGSLYNGLTPHRILDSRDGTGGYSTPWGPATTRNLTVAGGSTTVPADATAVVLNVTVTGPTAPSHLTVWPTGLTQPSSSNLNDVAGQTVANAVVVKTGTSGQVSIFNNAGSTQVIVDVMGYYTSTGSVFTPLTPHRILDSRDGTGGYGTPWGGGATRNVGVAGGATTVPSTATAVVVNLTGVHPTSDTHIEAWPTGIPMPLASNLNLPAGDVRANLAIVKIGSSQQISLFNNQGAIDLVGDVVGYYQ